MKNLWICVVLAAGAGAADRRSPDVIVYFHHGTQTAATVSTAQAEAEEMLASVGISIAWRMGAPQVGGSAEVIEAVLVDHVDEAFMPGALAFATLGAKAGTRIEIFSDRVKASGPAAAVPAILAHALVHEITHVLEGVNRHSAEGVLKAHWTPQDFCEMRRNALPFANEDVRLIRDWERRRLLVAAAPAAAAH